MTPDWQLLVSQLKFQFEEDDLLYLDAIFELQEKCGFSPREAEEIVETWSDEPDDD